MVQQLMRYGIKDKAILDAMGRVRRHVYIPEARLSWLDPYGDYPCPIGYGQTISQPYIVAYMTERLSLKPGERILEIGTGSGYQAAVLAELGLDVYTIEIVPELADHAREILAAERYSGRVHIRTGDGYKGWPEKQPFDAVILTCAPPEIPVALVKQLAEGGRMIAPVGSGYQQLVLLRKKNGKIETTGDIPVRFVRCESRKGPEALFPVLPQNRFDGRMSRICIPKTR